MRSLPLRALAAVLAASLLACADGGDPTAATFQAPDGTIRFTLAGAETGVFAAEGAFRGLETAGTRSWAFGADFAADFDRARPFVGLIGRHHGGGEVGDEFTMAMDDPAVGTVTCDAAAVIAETCPFSVFLALGQSWSLSAPPRAEYEMVSGTLTVTRLGSRLSGTFALTLADVLSGARAEVTGATFDVPMVPSSAIGARLPGRGWF